MSFRPPSFVFPLLFGFSLNACVIQKAHALWGGTQAVAGQSLAVPVKPQLVDLNGDGADDLVYAQVNVTDNSRSAVFGQLSDGAGQFADRMLLGEPTSESVRLDELVFADFEGDGDVDLFDLRDGTLALNNGSGSFGPLESIGVDALRPSVAIFGEEIKVTVFGFTREEPRRFQGYQVDDAGLLAQVWDVSLSEFASLNALLLSGPQDFNGNGQPELRYRLDGEQWLVERTGPATFEARMFEDGDRFDFYVDINGD